MGCCDAEARCDPPWTHQRRPSYDCRAMPEAFPTFNPDTNQLVRCQVIHDTIVGLLQAHPWAADPWEQDPQWLTPVQLWQVLRFEAPDILWGTTVRAMGKRLAGEGWKTRWKGSARVYYLADLPQQKGKRLHLVS